MKTKGRTLDKHDIDSLRDCIFQMFNLDINQTQLKKLLEVTPNWDGHADTLGRDRFLDDICAHFMGMSCPTYGSSEGVKRRFDDLLPDARKEIKNFVSKKANLDHRHLQVGNLLSYKKSIVKIKELYAEKFLTEEGETIFYDHAELKPLHLKYEHVRYQLGFEQKWDQQLGCPYYFHPKHKVSLYDNPEHPGYLLKEIRTKHVIKHVHILQNAISFICEQQISVRKILPTLSLKDTI